LIFFYNIF